MSKYKCKACGTSFHGDEHFTAEDNLRMHIAAHIQSGDLDHIFAYPEMSNIKEKVPEFLQRCQRVSVDRDMGPWKWDKEYFYEARIDNSDRVLYIIFSDGGRFYTRDYSIHLLVEDADIDKLKKIAEMARFKFYKYPTHFWVTKIDDKYAIVSRNFDSDIDKYCQSLWDEDEEDDEEARE